MWVAVGCSLLGWALRESFANELCWSRALLNKNILNKCIGIVFDLSLQVFVVIDPCTTYIPDKRYIQPIYDQTRKPGPEREPTQNIR